MEMELVNKIADLAFYGFLNPSSNIVTVHFFNEENDKADIIAYLKRDMSWDVREVVEEITTLGDDRETVVIMHNPLGIEPADGDFDKLVRSGLERMGHEIHGEEVKLQDVDPMFYILDNDSYNDDA